MGFWASAAKATSKAGKFVGHAATKTGKALGKASKNMMSKMKQMTPTNRLRNRITSHNKNLRTHMNKQFAADKRRLQTLKDKGELTATEFKKQMAELSTNHINRLQHIDDLYANNMGQLDDLVNSRRKQVKKDMAYAEEQLKLQGATEMPAHAQNLVNQELKDFVNDMKDTNMAHEVKEHMTHDFDKAWKENPQAVKNTLQQLAEIYPNAKMRKLVKNVVKLENIPLAMKKQIVDTVMRTLIEAETVGTALASTMEGLDYSIEQEKQRTIREYLRGTHKDSDDDVSFGTNIIGEDWA